MMRILWISSIALRQDNGFIFPINKAGAVSGSLFQQGLIDGLEQCGATIDIISDYPTEKRHNAFFSSHSSQSKDFIMPSFGKGLFGRLKKTICIKKTVRDYLRNNKYDFVIAYLIHSPYMAALKAAKKTCNSISTTLICPDLPDMMDFSLREKRIKSFLKKIDYKVINRLYSYTDSYVLFTEHMSERIPVEAKPSIVIEGISSVENLSLNACNKEKALLYAGTLHKGMGIEKMIDALAFLPADYKFWIFGDGDLKQYILDCSKKDHRIEFFGFVDRETVFEYEKRASLLINLRDENDAYTKYSFPSKTFEYLYSGTPFLTTKLLGVPKEYDKYLYFVSSDISEKELASMIENIISNNADSNVMKQDDVRTFVLSKDKQHQGQKMYSFLSRIRGKERK